MDKLILIRNLSKDLSYELFLALRNAGLSDELAERVINDPSMVKIMVDAVKAYINPASNS